MISHLSLRTTVLVVSILLSGILVPYTAFASPVFETDTQATGNSFFETEQSITTPLYFSFATDNEDPQISDLDVVVYDETEVYVVFKNSISFSGLSNVYLSYTNSSITNGPNGYFVDSLNSTQTVQLNENGWDRSTAIGAFNPVNTLLCHSAFEPKLQ